MVNFLPVLMDEYFHYHGSLTTGGCQESVNWMVFKNPLAIKEKHLKAFQSLKNKNGANIANNFRPIQPVNDRCGTMITAIFYPCCVVQAYILPWDSSHTEQDYQ